MKLRHLKMLDVPELCLRQLIRHMITSSTKRGLLKLRNSAYQSIMEAQRQVKPDHFQGICCGDAPLRVQRFQYALKDSGVQKRGPGSHCTSQ